MKNIVISSAVAALISSSSAIKVASGPDVFGPNGQDYTNNNASYDFSRIGIDVYEQGKGEKCTPGDWATVHYQGYLKDGRKVTDSTDQEDGRPLTFAVGASEVFKCWDLAITQLHQGDKVKIRCPYDLAYGNAYTWPLVGGEPIPLHSDVDFDFQVLECGKQPERTEYFKQPVTTTMQPNVCMYLHMFASEDVMHDLVLSAVDNGETPLNVLIEEKVWHDKSQEWYFTPTAEDPQRGTLHNAAHPDLGVTFLAGGNVGLGPLANATVFYYDPRNSHLDTGDLSHTQLIYAERAHDDTNVVYNLRSIKGDLKTAKWRIEYCGQYFGS